jgi:hypothetical protein
MHIQGNGIWKKSVQAAGGAGEIFRRRYIVKLHGIFVTDCNFEGGM